jgi:alpha-D-xyloside xylohydrolase
LDVNAPLDTIPLYVRAGSIMPLGPEIQYTGEKPDAPIELRIYRGADGHFELYEDSGDTYDYQMGQHSVIAMSWDDKAGQFTLGARNGSFPGMIERRRSGGHLRRPERHGEGSIIGFGACSLPLLCAWISSRLRLVS